MAIADTITSMQNHTSNAYTMIGYGTDLTGINKNLENLSSTIFEAFLEALRNPDTLFTNLPKTSGSGSQITLNGTANAPMRINLNPTAISQDGTPTPDTPQDIHTISGNNSVVVEGKNLFDGVYANAIVGSDGKYTDNNTTRTAMIEVEPNTTYSIKKFANTGMGTRFLIVESATKLSNGDYGTYIYSNISTTEYTHTTGNNIKYLYIYVTNDTTSIPYLMVVKGSTIPTTYTPYVSQTAPINLGDIEYCKIPNTDYKDNFVRNFGKNLFDISSIEESKYINGGTGATGTSSASNLSDYIEVESGETYKLTYNYNSLLNSDNRGLCYFNSSKTYISGVSYNPTTKTYSLSIPSNAKYVRFAYDKNCYDIMFNKGTTTLPYEPYGTNEWYIKKNIRKAILGNDIIFLATTGGYYSQSVNDYAISENTPYCNWYKGISNVGAISGINDKEIAFNQSPSPYPRLYLKDSDYSNVSTLNSDLSTNNVLIYYPLATPTYTKITGELAEQLEQVYKGMLSYDGTTNISQVNNDLPFVINASGITK